MKILNRRISFCIVVALIFLSGCANTPSENKKSTSATKGVELSADEQKSYQDALEAIKTDEADKALQPLVKIVHSHPEHLGAWINLSNAYLKGLKINDAENAVARAKALNPKVAEIYNLQGLINVQKGEYGNAEKNYLQAIQLKDNYAATHYNLGLLYDMYYQDIDRAIVQYDRYLELSDGTDKKTSGWVTELKQKVKRRNKS
jgi:Tfp pilus assembly protein PilF